MAPEEQKITATFPINLLSIPIWIWGLSPWCGFPQHQERSIYHNPTDWRLWTHPLSFYSHRLTSRLARASVLRGTPEWIPAAGSPLAHLLQIRNVRGVLWGLLWLWGCVTLSRRRITTLKVSLRSVFIPVSYTANSLVSATPVSVCMDDQTFPE